jgi:hypothetical protein
MLTSSSDTTAIFIPLLPSFQVVVLTRRPCVYHLRQMSSVEQGGLSQGLSLPQQVVPSPSPSLSTLKLETNLSRLSLPQLGHLPASPSRLRRKTSHTSPHWRHL